MSFIYDRRAKVGLYHLESSYQFLQFDFTFGIFQNCTHMCASTNRKKSPHSYHYVFKERLHWGTSINDVQRFLMIFDPPTYHVRQFLTCNVQFWGVILDPLTYLKIGHH